MHHRSPVFRASFERIRGEMVVDNFAGGGGASTGISAALQREPDIAINHSKNALAIHAANHPGTKHFCEDIWEVDPVVACAGRQVGLAWFSPDCTHFSRAKGTKPLKKEIRGLAWVVIRWAKSVKPRVIILENVEEFQTWGPLNEDGRPAKGAQGETFRQWLAALTSLGYHVEYRALVAADYGTPTTRKRFFLIARCDGAPIVWPDATHGTNRTLTWRPASEVIDWSLPVQSIFGREKPLAEATLRRIALGIQRYVINATRPFVAPSNNERSVAEPFVVRHGHYSTITGAGLREGCGAGTFRGQRLSDPLATVCATNDKHLVCPIVTKHYGGVVGHGVEKTLGTVTSVDHHALSAALLERHGGGQLPLHHAANDSAGDQVQAFLVKYYGADGRDSAQTVLAPLHTITSKARFGLVTVQGQPYRIVDIGMRMLQPRELFSAQGFPADYIIDPVVNGKVLGKTAQTAAAGNSVCPQVAEALVRANVMQEARQTA